MRLLFDSFYVPANHGLRPHQNPLHSAILSCIQLRNLLFFSEKNVQKLTSLQCNFHILTKHSVNIVNTSFLNFSRISQSGIGRKYHNAQKCISFPECPLYTSFKAFTPLGKSPAFCRMKVRF